MSSLNNLLLVLILSFLTVIFAAICIAVVYSVVLLSTVYVFPYIVRPTHLILNLFVRVYVN